MASAPSTPTFAVAGTRQLRALGLEGSQVFARLDGDRLVLTGEKGGETAIALSALQRIRVGIDDAKYGPFYETRLWRNGDSKPLMLMTKRPQVDGYADFVRAAARTVAGTHSLARVERGLTAGGALFAPLLMFPLVVGAVAISLFALGNEPWWGRLLVPALPTLLFMFLVWRCRARQYPRAVSNLAELERFLP